MPASRRGNGQHGAAAATDCLVIGSGAAGAVYALRAAQEGLSDTLVTGAEVLASGNSGYAQGGIVFEEHDPQSLRDDMATATAGTTNPAALETLIDHGPRVVSDLLIGQLEVPFDRDDSGALRFTREASHSRERIVYAKDQTGRAIVDAVHRRLHDLATHAAAVGSASAPGRVRILTGSVAIDLLTLSHSSTDPLHRYDPLTCVGAYVLDVASGEVTAMCARRTILATGGLGQIFLHSTNHPGAFGQGIAMAYRVGARVIDLEYVQFHPTVFLQSGSAPFLVSEALRGEGAMLVDRGGARFMDRYHELGSLAPRDNIARSIHTELLKSGNATAFLDATGLDGAYLRERFPTISGRLLGAGIDMSREPIPVVPAAHYSCGGVHADMSGNTNVGGLSAIGEVACTGVHGANRLASTSLLECVVMADLAATQHAAELRGTHTPLPEVRPWVMADRLPDEDLVTQDLSVIRNTMWNYVGLMRTTRRLERATSLLRELKSEVDSFYAGNRLTRSLLNLRSAAQTAFLVTYAALHNLRSQGCHFRTDDEE